MHLQKRILFLKRIILLTVVILTAGNKTIHAQSGINDTIKTYAVVIDGDTALRMYSFIARS